MKGQLVRAVERDEAGVMKLRSRFDKPERSHTSPNKTSSVYAASAGAMF
jgi:hypothetical protein